MTKRHNLLAIFALILSLLSLPSWAIEMDQAKAAGMIGEQVNGYLGYVTASPSSSLQAVVEEINAKRREAYVQGAQNAGVERKVFEIRMGQRLQERTPKGQYIQLQNGRWQKK